MGFNIRGGDKSSLALLSSKRGKAYAKSKADEAFALPAFSDAIPAAAPTAPPPGRPQVNGLARNQKSLEQDAENVKQTMLQHESVFKEQLHELHRLYQRQCMLMAESSSCSPPDRVPEPPSSNSSLLCNSETLQLQEDRSSGNGSLLKVCNSNQGYQALLSQMNDAKRLENCGSSRSQISLRSIDDREEWNRKQGKHHVLNSEQSVGNRLIIDLERRADDQLEIEPPEEKPHMPSLSTKSEHVPGQGHSSCYGSNKEGEKTEIPAGVSRVNECNKLFGFYIGTDVASESAAGAKQEMHKGFQDQEVSATIHAHPVASWDKKLFGINITDINHKGERQERSKNCLMAKESAFNHLLPLSKASAVTLACAKEEPFSYCERAGFTSEPCRGLPDLNIDANFTEGQAPPLQALSHNNAKDNWYVDHENNSRPDAGTSKLPHWLCQAPSLRSLPSHCSLQSSASQPKSLVIFPQVHDMTIKPSFFQPQLHDKTNMLHKLPMSMTKASAMYVQDPRYSGSQSSVLSFDRREAFIREVANTSTAQSFYGSNVGILEQSFSNVQAREYGNGSIPYYSSQVRENEKLGTLPLISVNLAPNIVERQGCGFEAQGLSAEFLSKFSSEGHTNFGTPFHWNQQTESFSSLLQQASNPEPFCRRSPHATSVSPWGVPASYQGPPSPGINYRNRSGLRTDTCKYEGSSLQPKSAAVFPMFEHMYAGSGVMKTFEGLKDSEYALSKQLETPPLNGRRREISSSDPLRDLNARETFLDLNVSSEDCMPRGCSDACNIMSISLSGNLPGSSKPENLMTKSSCWGDFNSVETPFMYQPQSECGLENTCCQDVVAAKCEPAATLSDTNMMHLCLHNDTYYNSSADNRYLEGDVLRDGIRADYFAGENEMGGGLVEAKSSDGSGLTSCESRDGIHVDNIKARNDSHTSSSDACHSLESRIPPYSEDVALSSSLQQKLLPSHVTGVSNSLLLQVKQFTSSHVDTRMNCSLYCKEFADESETANVASLKDLVETSEVAEILFSLGLDLPPTVREEDSTDDCRKCLCWLADIIPDKDYNQDIDVEVTNAIKECSEFNTQTALDAFEFAVLALKPVDPKVECIATQPPDRGYGPELVPALRRRASRRGRAGKDFQKEMLRSMSALSRHEVSEDLQIIEGLIKSAAETTNSCSTSPEKPSSSPEQMSFRSFGKAKSTLTFQGRKGSGLLNVCSWGGTMRRKRMGRQRSQWLSLPPGVRMSLFSNDATDVTP